MSGQGSFKPHERLSYTKGIIAEVRAGEADAKLRENLRQAIELLDRTAEAQIEREDRLMREAFGSKTTFIDVINLRPGMVTPDWVVIGEPRREREPGGERPMIAVDMRHRVDGGESTIWYKLDDTIKVIEQQEAV